MFRYVFYRETNATHHRGSVDAGSDGYNAQLHTDTGANPSVSKYRMKGKTSASSSASGFVDCTWVKASVSGLQVRPLTEAEVTQNADLQDGQGAAELTWNAPAPISNASGFLLTGTRRDYATSGQVEETRRITISDGSATSAIVGDLDEFYWDWTVEILNDARPTTAPSPTPLPMLETPTIDALFNNHDTTATLQWDNDPEAAGHNTFIGSTFHKYYAAGSDTITIPDSASALTLNLNGSTEVGVVATAYGNLISARASDTVDATNDFAAPNNVTASRTGENTVDITWDPVPGAGTTYNLLRRTTLNQGNETVTTVATGLSGLSFTDTTVTQGVSTWEVTAVSASGVTATSNPVHAVDAPTITSIVSNNDGTATITWDEAPNTTGLNLFLNGVYTPPFINGNNSNTTSTNSTTIADGSYTVTLQAGAGSNNILGATSAAFTMLGTPTNLTKANTSNSADIVFNWDPVTGATGYVLRVTPPNGPAVDYTATSTSVTVNDLTPTTPGFTATVTAHNAANNESSASTPVPFATRPDTVTGVTLTQTAGGLHLTWDHVPGAYGYDVRRVTPTTTNSEWRRHADHGTSYIISSPGTQDDYTYEVRATGNGLKGINYSPSNTTNYDTTAPTPPTALTISSITETGFDAAWAASTDGTGTGVSHYLLVTKDTQQNIVDTQTIDAPTTTATIGGLTASTSYTIEVTAVDNQTNTSTTTTQTLTTTTPTDTQRPTPPGKPIVDGQPGATTLTIHWEPSTDGAGSGVKEYRIYHDNDGANPVNDSDLRATVTGGAATTITGLIPGTVYNLYIKTVDHAGNTSYRSGFTTITTNTAATQPPATPAAPTGTDNSDQTITVNWLPVTGASTYEVYRDVSATDAADPALWPTTPQATITAPTTTWTDPGLLPVGSTHTYRIVAVNAAGDSAMSDKTAGITVTNNGGSPVWHTAEVNGRWEIINPAGQTIQWDAVNVRSYGTDENDAYDTNDLDIDDIKALKERFGYVRLNLNWQELHSDTDDDGVGDINAEAIADIKQWMAWLDDPTVCNTDGAGACIGNAQVGVILDIAHFGHSGTGFWIPDWAWENIGKPAGTHARESFDAWAGADNSGAPLKLYIDELNAQNVLTHDAVVAVEIVNEPHPRQQLDDGAYGRHAQISITQVYAELTQYIQAIQVARGADTRIVVLNAYYGGSRFGSEIDSNKPENGGFQYNWSKDIISDSDTNTGSYEIRDGVNANIPDGYGLNNTVWAAHNYYFGIDDSAAPVDSLADGWSNKGGKNGMWNETTVGGCYTRLATTNSMYTCGSVYSFGWNTSTVQNAHAAQALTQDNYSQAASMPFFMGEWGVKRQGFRNGQAIGFEYGEVFLCDKLDAYADIDGNGTGISWATWSFDHTIDGYGLYNARNSTDNGDSYKTYLTPNSWLDTGSFPTANHGSWGGTTWEYATPFAAGSGCGGR